MNYTKQQNNRRYKLHYRCRQNGVGVDVKHKTCKVLYNGNTNKYAQELVKKFNYVVQSVLYLDDMRVIEKQDN